ncbi:MAG: TolC family protein [Emcibacter sp.]|nr:TolC family protein [Emcibacter sp.]
MTQRKNKAVLMLLLKVFSVILMIGLLTSCGYNKNFSDPDHEIHKNIVKIHSAVVPETWQTQSRESHISSLSWNDFADLKLTYLIKKAFQDNLTLRGARLRLKNAHINLEQAKTGQRPSLSLGSFGANLSYADTGISRESYSLGATSSYQVDLWGRIENSISQPEIALENEEISLIASKITIAQSITTLYFNIRAQDKLIRLQEEQIHIQEKLRDLSRVRLSAGVITSINVDQIDVSIQSLKSNLEIQIANRFSLERSLSIILGQSPQTFKLLPRDFIMTPIPRLKPYLPAETLRQRPDLRIAENSLRSADISIDTAKKAWLPNLSLNGSANFRSITLSDLLTGKAFSSQIAAAFSALIYDNGNRKRALRRSQIAKEQSLINYQRVVLSVLSEVENALTSQEENIRQIEIQALQEQAQERVTKATKIQYEGGVASAFDLIREQGNELNVQRNKIRNWQAGMRISANMLVVLGVSPELQSLKNKSLTN